MPLNDVFAAGVQSASAAGSGVLGKPVDLAVRGVQQGGWELLAGQSGLSAVIPVALSQDVNGNAAVLLDARVAALMGELILGNDPGDLPSELSDLNTAAAAEALSQMVAAMGDGIGRASRRKVHAAAGELVAVSGDAGAAARGAVKESRITVVDCELKVGAHAPSRLVVVLSGSVAESLAAERAAAPSGPELTLGPAQGAGGGQRVQPVQFGTIVAPGASAEGASMGNLDLLMDVPLEITVELGRANRRVRDVLSLGPGSIVELSKLAGEPVDLLVNGKLIAKGEVVVIDENFAVRIIEILAREERLAGGL
jgi:flagellar motor switch protein FliN/FliY